MTRKRKFKRTKYKTEKKKMLRSEAITTTTTTSRKKTDKETEQVQDCLLVFLRLHIDSFI